MEPGSLKELGRRPEPSNDTRRWIIGGGLGLLAVCCAIAVWLIVLALPGNHHFEATRSMAAGNSTILRISAKSGSVSLRPSTDQQIHARASGSYTSHRPALVLSRNGRTATLSADCPPTGQLSCTVNVVLTLPANLAVRVGGANSTISTADLRGPQELHSINGAIIVTDPAGPLNLDSENGDISVSGGTARTLVVRTMNGAVRANFRAAPTSADVTSANGSVTIGVPPSSGYAIDAESQNGGTTIDRALQNGRARRRISVRTSNGSITIQAA